MVKIKDILESHPDGKSIIYKAAAEKIGEDEAKRSDLETFIIKVEFICIRTLIPDFMSDISQIGKTFKKLLSMQNIGPIGYCLDIYVND